MAGDRLLPARPRLAEHAMARLHVADGEDRVVLHDTRTGGLVRLGPREWTLLSCADGTRDIDGIVLAAARAGAHARAEALRGFLAQLAAARLLEEGPEPQASDEAATETPADRPVAALPGFTLACDGRGGCCRQYASIVFSPVEAARARSLLPLVRDGGLWPARAFSPERGSVGGGAAAVTMIDGRCAYLDGDARCGLHAAAGPVSKPLGCQLFPATFVDDGDEVRVAPAVECACVVASAGRTDGAPLVPPGARARGDLDPQVLVTTLPEVIAIDARSGATRAAIRWWSRHLAGAVDASIDAPTALWSLALSAERDGLDEAATRAALARPVAPTASALRPWFEALAARAARRVRENEAWRGERDLARIATERVRDAAARLLGPHAASAAAPIAEALYARATIFGHHLVGDLPLGRALRDRAVRLLVARALGPPRGDADPALGAPVAVVESMLRGHGLDAYAHDLG